MCSTRLAALVLIALVPGAATAQEKIANPEFAHWSKFKKGTTVTLKTVTEAAGVKGEMTMTLTLVEVGADKIVVASSGVAKANGMEFKSPPTNRDIPRIVELPKGVKKEPLEAQTPEGKYEEGTETLKVAGVEVKTKWYKYKYESEGIKAEGKMWTSEEVPGWIVKSEARTGGESPATMKTELVEFKKP
jgi:hypothetical protein